MCSPAIRQPCAAGRAWLSGLLIMLLPALAQADRFREGAYDERIPTTREVLGFDIGDRPTHHEEVVRYAEALAMASPRVELVRYATSHEGRDLIYMLITSTDHQRRIAEIQQAVLDIADPRVKDGEALIADTPAVAYLAHSIHGNELSGGDAAMRLAYELAAGQSDDIREILDNVVVLIDPLENPDGRERILQLDEGFRGAVPNPDPEALNHVGFWPGGRTNHYLFDLNRDWFALVHPESRGRANIIRRWRPQLVVDAHEMGSTNTFLFSPPRDPFNPNLPSSTLRWWERYASDMAGALDAHGWSYYTREWNEEFFPGYGSGLPLYSGAVGMLYEQARTAGQPTRKPSGRVVEYWDAVAHQFTSGLANLRTTAGNREALLRTYRAARAEAMARGGRAPARAFYITPRPDRWRAERLAMKLAAIGIEVERLGASGPLPGAHALDADGSRDVSLPAGSFRIRLDQPDGLLARAILEPHTPMPDSSLAKEREQVERQRETRIYDTTAWSPLLASGLECWWSARLDGLSWSKVNPEADGSNPTFSDAQGLPGAGASAARYGAGTSFAGRVREGTAQFGWVFDGSPDGAVVFAAKLAARGHKVRVGLEPFELGDVSYGRGSYLVRIEDNGEGIEDALKELAAETGVDVVPLPSARNLRGPDFGGEQFTLVREPRIAIAMGSPVSGYSAGYAWNLLDREVGIRVSLVDVSDLGDIDLERYNVLVLPDLWSASPASYGRALGPSGTSALKEWVEGGGTLVAIGMGAHFIADSAGGLSSVRRRAEVLEGFPPPTFGLGADAVAALERLQATGLGPDGEATPYAGPMTVGRWPQALGIPGPGSPVLGPGTWALLGDLGERARKRGALAAADGVAGDEEKKADKEALEKADERLRRLSPSGALLRVDLDPYQWLAWGSGDRVTAMMGSSEVLIAKDPAATAGRFAAPDGLHLGGLLWPEAAGRIARTAFLTREGVRDGQVVLFADEPNFRGYFWGTGRLFLNAVLLGPALGTKARIGW